MVKSSKNVCPLTYFNIMDKKSAQNEISKCTV